MPASKHLPAVSRAAQPAPAPSADGLGRNIAAYRIAPEPWQTFLLQARKADAIADPLQRCLAYPPLPDTHWPEGMLQAHCEYVFGLGFKLDEFGRHVDAGDVAWMDRTFRELQDRHFSETNFSEHIHDAFELFDGGPESDKISKRWLELAPGNAFALTARAEHFRHLGWNARGAAFIQDTPAEQQQAMQQSHGKAFELYRQALAKEPKMLQAYVGLIDMGKNEDGTVGESAFVGALALDPACKVVLTNRMDALRPRWGGSLQQMRALEQQIIPMIPRRPLVALSRVRPYQDLGSDLLGAGRQEDGVKAFRYAVDLSSSAQVQSDLAIALDKGAQRDEWEELAYLVSASRFNPQNFKATLLRGRLLQFQAADFPMAEKAMREAIAMEPRSARAHVLLADALFGQKRWDESLQEYRVAAQLDPDGKILGGEAQIKLESFENTKRLNQ